MSRKPGYKEIELNIYDDESVGLNVVDTTIGFITDQESQSVIDLALEIAYRVNNDMPIDIFLDHLVSVCEDADLI